MTLSTWIILAVVSLIFSALFSGTEIAYITSDRVRVELDVKRGGMLGKVINLFYKDEDLFISTILVGNNIMLVIYGMGAAYLIENQWLNNYQDMNEALRLIISTLISTGVILVTGEFFPKTIFRINPYASLKVIAMPLAVFYFLLWPVSVFTAWLSRTLMRICGIKSDSQKMGMLSVGDLNRYLETNIDEINPEKAPVEHEVKIFHNALDFSNTHVRDCMLPRNEIVAVNIATTTREMLSKLFTESGRSKIVVYADDIDNVLGYIHVSELFNPETDWKQHIKPVIFAPEALLANKLMRRLLSEKRSMAVVVDEFGGTAGLVTLEDLVEEIFGDIRDEHDTATDLVREVEPNVFECSGRVEIETLREQYHIDIPEDDDYQTLAGFILTSTGQLPPQGETIRIDRFDLTILKRTASRLEQIRIAPVSDHDSEQE
ncbi:MAG: hemolysin family protein [Firmicutes bacterium]|nr:hemolysin family protein [Bacillota bacterium]MCM1400702.1 hemolysin family protein [Bacteroides sp.]MCM1476396.1 hemolysin family protein [Bacteroides sp.]